MRRTVVVSAITFAALGLTASPALANHTSAAQVNENANCLAVERAERNSAGGDREKGRFGQEQSAFVVPIAKAPGANFGDVIQAFMAACP